MDKEISSNYMCYVTTKELWESLEEMYFDLRNKSQIHELTLKVKEIQHGSDNVTKYFHFLKRVLHDLDLFSTKKWKLFEDRCQTPSSNGGRRMNYFSFLLASTRIWMKFVEELLEEQSYIHQMKFLSML
jgi:hypothetical protein